MTMLNKGERDRLKAGDWDKVPVYDLFDTATTMGLCATEKD